MLYLSSDFEKKREKSSNIKSSTECPCLFGVIIPKEEHLKEDERLEKYDALSQQIKLMLGTSERLVKKYQNTQHEKSILNNITKLKNNLRIVGDYYIINMV